MSAYNLVKHAKHTDFSMHGGVGLAGSGDMEQGSQTLPGYYVLRNSPLSAIDSVPSRQVTLPAQAASAASLETIAGSPMQAAQNVFDPAAFTAGLFPGKLTVTCISKVCSSGRVFFAYITLQQERCG